MQLTPKERALYDRLLEKHVPKILSLVVEVWENPLLREHLSRDDYREVLELVKELDHINVKHEAQQYVEQIKEFIENPFGG